jgi:hypothetical protein
MNEEERRKWAKILDGVDRDRQDQIDLEQRIIQEERERIRIEIAGWNKEL